MLKKSNIIRCFLCGLILCASLIIITTSVPSSAFAGEGFVIGKWAYTRLSKAHELIGKKKYTQTLEVLSSIGKKKRLNDHERAMMWQTYGFVWSSMEKFHKAIKSFEKCLALNAMPDAVTVEIKFNLGQLYMATRRFKKATRILNEWLSNVENPSPTSYYLLAMAYAQNKQYKKALSHAKAAISKTQRPKQSWYQFLLSLHFQLKNDNEITHTLEILAYRYPKKSYLLQLAAAYGKQKREKEILAVMEIAYMQNYLNRESEFLNLASLYLHHGIPYNAALILEKSIASGIVKENIKSLKMLADSWQHAREPNRAIGPLKRAAKQDKKGDLYVQLAQIYLERENWKAANRTLNKALKKRGLSNPGMTHLLHGIAKHNLSQHRAALNAFARAQKHKGTKNAAKNWIKIVGSTRRGS